MHDDDRWSQRQSETAKMEGNKNKINLNFEQKQKRKKNGMEIVWEYLCDKNKQEVGMNKTKFKYERTIKISHNLWHQIDEWKILREFICIAHWACMRAIQFLPLKMMMKKQTVFFSSIAVQIVGSHAKVTVNPNFT